MDGSPEPRAEAVLRLGRALATGTALISAVVAVSWMLGLDVIARAGAPGATMKFTTALCLVALGIGALLTCSRDPRSRGAVVGALAAAAVAARAAILALAEYALGTNIGIDELVVADRSAGQALTAPGRMAPQTAVAIIVLAAALSAQHLGSGLARAGRWLAVLGAVAPVVVLFQVLGEVDPVLTVPGVTQMALPTAVALIAVAGAVVVSDPARAPIAPVIAEDARGALLRRILPATLAVPLASGALVVFGLRLGLYPAGPAMLAIVGVAAVGGCLVAWLVAERLGRVDERRRRSEERMSSLVEGAPVGIYETDRSGGRVFANPAWYERAALDPARSAGGSWLKAVHPDDRDRVRQEWERAAAEGGAVRSRFRYLSPDGRNTWVEGSASPMTDRRGEPIGWIGSELDVTAQVVQEMELSARESASRAIAASTAIEEVFATITGDAGEILEADASSILRAEGPSATVVAGWSREPFPHPPIGRRVPIDGLGAEGSAIALGRTCERHHDDPTEDATAGDDTRRSVIAAPVAAGGKTWGSLSVTRLGGRPFDPGAGRRLERFADLVAIAVVTDEARTRLRTQARTDHLTGLPNARAFHLRLDEEIARARRTGVPLALIALDIDRFKQVNDRFGHPVGDDVLREVAARMRTVSRAEAAPARVGGEEFACVVIDGSVADALAVAERLRAAVASHPIAPAGTITLSAGIAALESPDDARNLIGRADAALYRAKENGRDRAVALDVRASSVG